MFTDLRRHLRDNKGDANVSKTTMIAIVFVVGAILLVMTTSAFRNPINRWFSTVTKDWFADSNGMYEADNKYLFAPRRENGTIEGATYIVYLEDDKSRWMKLPIVDNLVDGQNALDVACDWNLNGNEAWGSYVTDEYYVDISDDGTYINIVDIADGSILETYYAELP